MKPLTNKGQVLVVFILLLPLLFFLSAIIIDFGIISIQKRKIENTIDDALTYALEEKDKDHLEENITTMLKSTISNIDVLEITSTDDEIEIYLVSTIDSGFKRLFDKDIYQIKIRKSVNYKE
jgi:Flp pilus assembly protein TadG